MNPHYNEAALKFLRGLKKNNAREWFDPRKSTYETELKAPTLAIIEAVNEAFATFAPEFVRPPHKIMIRIYRDIRFSPNKQPYKTHVAAWWARQGLEKTSGGGFYFHFGAGSGNTDELRVAAGCYMPEKEQLHAIRTMLLERHEELRRLMSPRYLKGKMTPFDGLKMTRGPKGFPANHPAADLILCRQWGVSGTLPVDTALTPTLVKEIVARFKLATPMVQLLNEPLAGKPKAPLF